MKLRLLSVVILLLLAASPAWAQSSSDFDSKYGAPQQSYEIRPGIFMIVKYAADGRACEMRIEKRHLAGSGSIKLDPTIMSPEELKGIVDELVPAAERGAKSKFSGVTFIVGAGGTASKDYENVAMTHYIYGGNEKYSGTVAIVIHWKNRGCEQ